MNEKLKAEEHRDRTEMELEEAKRLLEIMLNSDEATLAEYEKMEDEVTALEVEYEKAKFEAHVQGLMAAFRNVPAYELKKTVKAKYGYADVVKEAAKRVLAEKAA